jgi:hypothetical protein
MNEKRSSAYWKERADEARAHAEEMRSTDGKKWMLEIASLYDRLAKSTAKREASRDERP